MNVVRKNTQLNTISNGLAFSETDHNIIEALEHYFQRLLKEITRTLAKECLSCVENKGCHTKY